jgi:glyoxylase-like metal-dependent hydrolase (beta-lactamase superfamily II)
MSQLLRDAGLFKEKISTVIPDVYQITYRAANVFLIVEDTLTLIDTGFRSTGPRIIDFIRRLDRRPEELRLIIITHCHPDHDGGMPELKKITGARTACHKADIMVADQPLPYPRRFQAALELRPLAPLRSRLGIPADEIDIKLQGGEELPPLGGLKVIHTPGHTPGSICLLAPKYKLLFAGDTLTRKEDRIMPVRRSVSLDTAQVLDSVQTIAGLDFDKVCFGHRQPVMTQARDWILEWLDHVNLKQA